MTNGAASGPLQTSLQCFAAVARHHGVDLAVERMLHDHALTGTEKPIPALLAIAQANGFRAKRATIGGFRSVNSSSVRSSVARSAN